MAPPDRPSPLGRDGADAERELPDVGEGGNLTIIS